MTRAFFIEFSGPLRFQVADKLQTRLGLEVAYWTSSRDLAPQVTQRFPQAVFHDHLDAVRGIPPISQRDLPRALVDAEVLAQMAGYENIILGMMDRMDIGGSFLFHERLTHYHDLLAYWAGVLDRLRPDLIVFSVMPHMVYDYVLYLLAQARGITTLMSEVTSVIGRNLIYSRIDDGCPALVTAYRRRLGSSPPAPPALSGEVAAYLEQLVSTYDQAKPLYIKHYEDDQARVKANRRWKSNLHRALSPRKWLATAREGWKFLTSPPPLNYIKWPGCDLASPEKSGLTWRRYRLHRIREIKRLEEAYQALTSPLDLEAPFIYVALHYQPEKTTSPQGGVFVDQILGLRLLAHHLPEGWWLYVKEAPGQFMPQLRRSPAKDQAFYRRIAAIPRVKIAAMGHDSFSLIDHARAVSTVTGTAGWEAVVRGKPALVFGHPWYLGCEGVYQIRTTRACAEAMAHVVAGKIVDPIKVRHFLAALEEIGFRANLTIYGAKLAALSDEESASAVAEALDTAWTSRQDSASSSA